MAESMRERVLKEIISTEKTYLRQLDILEKFFEKPCIEKCLLPTNVHTSIFGELSTLRRMNEELYKELTAEDSNVGQAFLHLAPFLKAYSSYANSYQTSLNLLQEWIVRSPELKVWLAGTESRPEVQNKLPSLLITPVQRVPRYRLLLEELCRYTAEDHPHYLDIFGALEEISRVAEHINKCVREGECVQRMLLLQKAFKYGQPNIIAPGRTLLKEGRLRKVSRKGSGSHERLFFLFSDMLVYTKIPSSSSMTTTSNSLQMGHVVEYKAGSLECCCVLPLKHCTVTPIFGSSNQCKAFRICCESEDLVLYSSDADEGNSWLLSIEEAIARLAAKRRTLRKESSSKKPMRRPALRKFTLKGNPNELQVLKATTQTVDSPKTPKCTSPPLPPPPPPPPPPPSSSVKTVTSPQPMKPPQTSKSPFARAKECFASPKMRLTPTSKKKKSKRKHEDVEVSENDEGGFERPKVKLKSLNSHIPTSPQRKWDPRDREQCLLDQFKRPKTVLLPCHSPSVLDGASFPTSSARQLTLQPPYSSVSTNTSRLVSSEDRGPLYDSLSPKKYPPYQTLHNPSEKIYIQKPLLPSNMPLPTGSFAPNKGVVPDRRIPYYTIVSPGKDFPQYDSPSPGKGFSYGSISPVRSPPYSSMSPRAPHSVSPSHGRFSLSPTRSISSHSSASLGGNTPPYNSNLNVRDRYSSVSPVRDRPVNTSLSPSVHGQMNNSMYSLSSSNPNTSISPVRGRRMNTSINSVRGELNNSRSPQGRYVDTSLSPGRRGQGNISDVPIRGRRMNTLRSPVNRQSSMSQSPDRISFCSNSPTRTTSYSGSPVRSIPNHTSISPSRSVSWYSSTSPARSLPSHSSGSPARSVASYSSTSPARSVSSYSSTSPARTLSSHSSGSPVRSIASYSSTSPARSVSTQSSSPVRPRSSCTSAVPTRIASKQSSNSGQYYITHRSHRSRSPQLCKSISPSRRPTSFGLISPVKTIMNSSRTSPAHGRAATHWDLNIESSKRPLSPGRNLSPNWAPPYGSNSSNSVSGLGSSPSHSCGTSRSDCANTSSGSIESSSSHKNVRRIMSLEYIRQHPALDTEV